MEMIKRITLLLFLSGCLFAIEKTFIREYTYETNWLDTKETARRISLHEIKTLLLEEVGVYISTELNINTKEILKDGRYEMDESVNQKITAITAGITKTEIVDEKWAKKWKNKQYWIKAKITLDPDSIQSKINKTVNNIKVVQQLEFSREMAQNAMAEIAMLKKQLSESEEEKEKIKLEYEQETIILLYTEIFDNAFGYITGVAPNKERLDKAISSLWRCVELDVNDTLKAKAYLELANCTTWLVEITKGIGDTLSEFDSQYYTEANQYLDKAIELNPTWRAYFMRAFNEDKLGDPTNALQYFDKAIEAAKHINNEKIIAETYMEMAGYFQIMGSLYYSFIGIPSEKTEDIPTALQYFDKAFVLIKQINMEYITEWENSDISYVSEMLSEFYYEQGGAYYDQGNTAKAIENYEKVIELKPDYAGLFGVFPTYYFLGNAYRKQGNTAKAIENYEKVIELDPDYALAYSSLGDAYRAQGNYTKAIKSYNKAIELKPDDADAYISLGNAYFKQGNSTRAIQSIKKGARLGHQGAQDFLKKDGHDW